MSQLCSNGLVVVRPSAEALQEMDDTTSAATPSDAATRLALSKIATAVPLGPQADASEVPSSCHVAKTEEQARAFHASSLTVSTASPSAVPGPTIPPGTYQVTVTKEQMAAAGLVGVDWQADITYTFTFEADGTVRDTQQPDYPDQGPMSAKLVYSGDEVTMTWGGLSPETVRWSFYQGTLTFTVISVQDQGSRAIYEQPWRKIA